MRSTASLAVSSLLVGLVVLAPGVPGQDAPPEEATAAVEEPAVEEPIEKAPFALYIEAATGSATPDDLETSITTLSSHITEASLSFDAQPYARAAIGWKLPRGRGDFRLLFNGFQEDGYTVESIGLSTSLDPQSGDVTASAPLPWWATTVSGGRLVTTRTPPVWTGPTDTNGNGTIDPGEPLNDDANASGFPDPGEQRYLPADINVDRPVTENLDNRLQTIEFLYGNSWGPRRFRGRWWAGFRYFEYGGNVLTTAWLNTAQPGEGYTDGANLHVLNFAQETTSFGPTGSLEVQFLFFEERLSLYLQGRLAFQILDVNSDSGPFYTLAETVGQGTPVDVPIPARLEHSISKSSWQDWAEVGARWELRNGLQFEVAYQIAGYLDVVLLPTQIRIPENTQEAPFGTSAVYQTQDLVFSGWRAGIAFQF